jgi:hypothetical protein
LIYTVSISTNPYCIKKSNEQPLTDTARSILTTYTPLAAKNGGFYKKSKAWEAMQELVPVKLTSCSSKSTNSNKPSWTIHAKLTLLKI